MQNDSEKDLFFHFSIASIPNERTALSDGSTYHVHYIDRGSVICKKKEGFVIYGHTSVLVVPPNSDGGLRPDSSTGGWNIGIGPALFDEVTHRLVESGRLGIAVNDVSFFQVDERKTNVYASVIATLVTEWNDRKPGFTDIIRLKLMELFINLSRIDRFDRSKTDREASGEQRIDLHAGAQGIDGILGILSRRYNELLSLDDLARETGFSTSYLSRSFKQKTGMCLFEYINRLRINRACYLLKNTGRRILEIAYEVGYNNVSFFNRYFRKTIRMSPLEYRKKSRR